MAIKAKITVDNKELKQGFKNAEKTASNSMKKIADTTKAASSGMNGMVTALGKFGPVAAVIAVALYGVVKAAMFVFNAVTKISSRINEMAKAAKAVNLSSDSFQALEFASKRSGIAIEQVQNMLTKLSMTFIKAADGSKEVIDAFSSLYISWSDLEKKSPDAWLLTLLHRLKLVNSEIKRNKILKDLGFNRRDIQNINKMVNGDYGRLVANAKNMGVTLTEKEVQMAERYADAIGDVGKNFMNIIAKWKLFKEVQESIMEIAKSASKYMIDGDGKVKEEFRGLYIGIGDLAESLEKYAKDSPIQEIRDIYVQAQKDIQASARAMALTIAERDYGQPVKLMSDKQKEETIEKFLPKVNMEEVKREVWKVQASRIDPRFDPGNKETWIQETLGLFSTSVDEEKIKMDQINGSIKRITNALNDKLKKHKEHIEALKNELTLADLIKKVEEETKGKLNEEQINELKDAFNEFQKIQGIDVASTLNEETERMKEEHQIQLALLDGDLKRANMLKTILKLKQAGINVTEEEFKNNQKNMDEIYGQMQNVNNAMDPLQANAQQYQDINAQIDYMKKTMDAYKNTLKEVEDEIGKTKDETRLQTLERRRTDLQNWIKKLSTQITDVQSDIAYKDLEDAYKQYQILAKQAEELEARLARAKAIDAGQKQNDETEKQNEEINKKNLELQTKELERQNEITQAELNGDLERANTLRLLNDLKQMGIDIDEEELQKNREKYDALIKQRELQRELNLNKSFQDQEKSLLAQAMRRVGLTKQAAYYEAVLNAERTKGAKLTEAETERVKRLVDLQFKINDPSLKLDLSGMGIKTNELTARGGFATGAVFTDKDKINSEIRNYAKRQADLLNEIKEEIKNGGLI